MSGNLKSLKDSLLPYLTPAPVALAALISLIEWATNSLRFARLSAEFMPMTPATALRFFLLGAVLLCLQRRSIFNFKLGNAYEVEYHVHAARA